MKKKIFAVIAAYNEEKHVNKVIKKTKKYIDNVILVDDGSKDHTVEIAESYGERVKVFHQENSGAAAARNNAVQHAHGKWVAFLDADDLWAPDKVEKQIAACPTQKWSHTNSVFIGPEHDGKTKSSDRAPQYGGNVLQNLVENNFIGTSSVIMRKDVFKELGGFDESLRAIQDWDLWLRAAMRYEIAYLPEVLGKYRVHASSTSRSTRKTLPHHLTVINRAFAKGGAGAAMPNLKKIALANSYGTCSIIAEESHDPWFALLCGIRALAYQPDSLWRWKSIARIVLREIPKELIRKH